MGEGDINLIAKVAPAGDGFIGMVEADQVLGGGAAGTLPDACVAASNVTQHQGSIDHGSVAGLADDDHNQYHNDARGDARYYTETELDGGQLDDRYFTEAEHLNSSAGAGDAGKPIKLDADGHVDATMVNDGDIDHTAISNIGTTSHADIDTHIADVTDPHGTVQTVSTQLRTASIRAVATDLEIVSINSGDINITPDGPGEIVLDGTEWPASGGEVETDFLLYSPQGKAYWAHFSELTEPSGGAVGGDWLCIQDVSVSRHRKVKVEDLPLLAKWRTRSFLIEVPTPADDDEFIVHWFPHAATLTQVRVHVKAATSTTFELTERGYDTPDAGGTDISAAAITATTTPTDVTMNNTGMAANSVLVYHSSAVVGTPGKVWIFGKYTVD